jgi:hypothetical protein
MESQLQNRFIECFSKELRPLDTRPLYDWLHDNIDLPNVFNPQGRFCIDFYPYLKAPMECLTDDNIKQLNLAACTQGGKSLSEQLFLPYIILESPGPVLMIHDTAENAKRVVEERIIPLLNNNKDTKRLLDSQRFSARKTGIQLPHMTCRISGPAESNIHGYSARIVLGDEVWQWQASGHVDIIPKLKARQTAYNATKKLVLVSQPDYEGSEFHKECMAGDHYEYGFRCPDCNILQLYEWNEEKDGKEYGMIMDKTKTDENGIGDYDKKAASARLVCQHCFHEIHDTPKNRKELVMNGDYIKIHSGNDKSIRTYSWNQYINISIPFKQIALTYFDAVYQHRTTSLRTKHELFRQQTMGRFWKMGQQIETKKLMTEAYSSTDEWKDETIRFLTIDPQKDYLNWLVRAWSNKVPECRLIDFGTVIGFSEIDELCKKYKIHPLCIGIDSGYTTRNVYAESVQRGQVITLANKQRMLAQWTCFKGDGGPGLVPKKFYKHKINEGNRTIEIDRFYSQLALVDPQFPVSSKFKAFKANLYAWSNYSIKTILHNLRDKKIAFNWKLNDRAIGDYTQQMFSEELNPKSGRFEQIEGRPNHIFDMECLQLVMALQSDCYHPSASEMNDIAASPELKPT